MNFEFPGKEHVSGGSLNLKEDNMATTSDVASSPERKAGELYPPIEPYNCGWLKVSDIHEIYYEESGNKDGKPVIFL